MPRDEEKFPGNSTEYYPDYIVGWLLITNPPTSARIVEVRPGGPPGVPCLIFLHQVAQTVPYLYIEDVWVTGILRSKMGITPIDMYGVRANTIEDLLITKTFQNTESYISDYITSISFPRDIGQYSICHLLEEDARRCYLTQCKEGLSEYFQSLMI